MFSNPVFHLLVVFILSQFAGGCSNGNREILTVIEKGRATYRCDKGERITAVYYALSDESMHFAKVAIAGGKTYTLPQSLSASGVRYTDDRLFVWWTKGNTAFGEIRSENSEWRTLFKNCKEIR